MRPGSLRVQVTAMLSDSLRDAGWNPEVLADEFREWKTDGAAGEYTSYYYGKDGDYTSPLRNGKPVLRHVHMPPASDAAALAAWEMQWRRRSRKTSDGALIYAYDHHYGYLLIFYAVEPTAHSLAQMQDADSVELMNMFADIAEAFIHDGTVIA